MVGCAAYGCSNQSEKGIRMYVFTRDRDRRWLAIVSRSNLTVAKYCNSRKLCQALWRSISGCQSGDSQEPAMKHLMEELNIHDHLEQIQTRRPSGNLQVSAYQDILSPDLNPIKHLWDELEIAIQAFSSNISA